MAVALPPLRGRWAAQGAGVLLALLRPATVPAAELGAALGRWCEACRVYEARAGERLSDSIKCATCALVRSSNTYS